MKKSMKSLFAILASTLFFMFVGCDTEVLDSKDSIPPNEVKNLTAINLDGGIRLTWIDPTDDDFEKVKISYSTYTGAGVRASSNVIDTLIIEKGIQTCDIINLTNWHLYTFTVQTVDKNGNTSSGISISDGPYDITMNISLVPNTTDETNQDVIINVIAESNGKSIAIEISSVKYATGEQELSYFADSGIEVVPDDNGEYNFTVSENDTYTVYVLDTEGRDEVKTIDVSNIDKILPVGISDFSSYYSYINQKIVLSWNTTDTDIDYYLLNCVVTLDENVSTVIQNTQILETSYEINNIESATGIYTITVKAVDKAGNIGEETTLNVTTEKMPYITNIELDRNHIAYNDTNKDINVTIFGEDFDLISNQEDKTVKVQLVDGSNITNYIATVDVENNSATATITAPTLSSATTDGTDYTVRVKICGTIDIENTANLNISAAATVTSISLSTSQISVNDVTSSTTTTATVVGTNLDVADTITIQLYDSTNTAYGSAITVDTSNFIAHEISFIQDIEVPTTNDIYTLEVFFGDTAQSTTAALQVYGKPAFTSFIIPPAGISKEDTTVTAIVVGKNFTAPDVTSSSFSLSCKTSSSKSVSTITSNSTITIISDSKLSVTLTIPGTADKYVVSIKSGSNSLSGTFTVKDYSSYTVGNIILADGSVVSGDSSYTEINTSNPPVAVVADFNDNGVALGVGLHCSSSSLTWVSSGTTGYITKFTDIVCTPITTGSGAASTATFTGDTDGSDNWDVICSVDPIGSADAETNYPAFYWANTYGSTYSSYLGGVTDGWYMPSIAELCYIYRNLTTINSTFSVIYNLNSSYADSSLGTSWFWSSSQEYYSDDFVWYVRFKQGSVLYFRKYSSCSVLVVRTF